MTREEAVTTLKDISEMVHKQKEIEKSTLYGILDSNNEPVEALDMAIKALEQESCEDCISRKAVLDMVEDMTDQFGTKHRVVTEGVISMLPPVSPKPKTGHWLRMSDLSEEEDDRYKCSHCGNVVHYKDKMNLYTFNSWCGRCGSDNGRKIEVDT